MRVVTAVVCEYNHIRCSGCPHILPVGGAQKSHTGDGHSLSYSCVTQPDFFSMNSDVSIGYGGYYDKKKGIGRDVEDKISKTAQGDSHKGRNAISPDAFTVHAVFLPPAPEWISIKNRNYP